jgi:hypothetical protein
MVEKSGEKQTTARARTTATAKAKAKYGGSSLRSE